ncbi:MAG: acyl-CoA desaturase [Myxococcota bacterium]
MSTTASTKTHRKPKFTGSNAFRKELMRRANEFFEEQGIEKRGHEDMYLKTAIILLWVALSYGLVVFATIPWYVRGVAIVSLGFAMAGVGFNIMHDAGHRAYSNNKRLNRLMFFSVDLMGASSYIWITKHNVYHHTYANIEGVDNDLEAGDLARFSPHQPHYWFHRFQHIYLLPLYGFMSFRWVFVRDQINWFMRRTGPHPIPEPSTGEKVIFWTGKAGFITLAFVIPSLVNPFWQVVLCYALVAYFQGFMLAIIFQLAHVVDVADFPLPDEDTNELPMGWAEHQLATTMDFAPNNPFVTWYSGGLNFQAIHHLFPNITHVHYPELRKIVMEVCEEFEVPYLCAPTFRAAVLSHLRCLKEMGRAPEAAGVALEPAAAE